MYAIEYMQILPVGDLLIRNAIAGSYNLLPHIQWIGASQVGGVLTGKCEWQWEPGVAIVKGAPMVIAGYDPLISRNSADTRGLPALLSSLPTLSSTFDVSVISSDDAAYNISFDMWIANTGTNPVRGDVTNEVMVWVSSQDMSHNPNLKIGRYTIDGAEYDFFRYINPTSDLHEGAFYNAFVRVIPTNSGTINFNSFLDWIVANDYAISTDYLCSISLGNEVRYGTGATTINGYTVIANDPS